MRTPRLPVVDWTDAPADLNGLVRFAERRNLVSARVPSHFNWPLPRRKYTGTPSIGGFVDHTAGLNAMDKRRISWPCNASNHNSSVVQPAAQTIHTPTTLLRLQDWTVALISRYISFSTSFAQWSLCPIVIPRRRGWDVRPLQYFDHQETSRQKREIWERGRGYQQLQCDTPIHRGWQSFITLTHEVYVQPNLHSTVCLHGTLI